MNNISILVAFGAGFVSFLAPCVLPIVPGFIAYLGGIALEKKEPTPLRARSSMVRASIFFVLGFTVVFAVLGLILHGALVNVGPEFQETLAHIGGIIIIFFGLYLMGLIKFTFFEKTRHISIHKKFSSHAFTSLVFGAAFALGWTPCMGAALGAILGLAALEPAKTFYLLVAYAFGLGVPFVIIGAFAGEIEKYLARVSTWVLYLNIIFGGVLVWLGVMSFTQNLYICTNTVGSSLF